MMKKLLVTAIVLNFISGLSVAQIHTDPTAPGNQRPTLLQTPNSVPQVDITTPSAGGVSLNQFRQFDISPKGVVINNGYQPSQTQLAGWIAANPWLAGGSAKVIIHQVNSPNPSTLQGYLEIAGNKADFILANPAGITCAGCGFLNAAHVQMATGKPQFVDGQPSGFDLGPGRIQIDGAGMDASRTGLAELITREARINAGLWARQLRVILAGPVAGTTASTAVSTAPSTTPFYALDVAKLGGMYAGKIWLIGTEHGLGVRNAGTLAGVDEFTLSIDGQIQNRGHIEASRVVIHATNLDNLGSGTILGDQVAIGGNRLNNIGNSANPGEAAAPPVIAASSSLDIGAEEIHNRHHAQLFSGGALRLGGALDDQGRANGNARLIHNASAHIEALGEMQIASEAFSNTNENFASVIDTISGPTKQFYIQPDGAAQKISGANFQWQRWSRAGLYRWKTDNPNSTASVLGQTPIPQISVEECVGEGAQEACTPTPETAYPRTDPAWAYFKLSAPEIEPVAPQLSKPEPPTLTRPIEPDPASDPDGSQRKRWATQQADYERAFAAYQQQQRDYDSAQSQYAQSREAWRSQTEARMDALANAIDQYNAGFAGAEIKAWTQFTVTRTERQSRVVASDPASLTAGGNLKLEGGRFVNDKSRITVGGTLRARLDQLDNIDAIGQHIVQESGTSQHTQSRWRGGFKRYHQRDWGPVLAYNPAEVVTSFSLPITALHAGTDTDTDPVTALSIWNARTLGGSNGLFHISDDPLRPLIETDPRFVQYRQWLSSDAMQNQLRADPAAMQKRLGDAYLEQRRVREHIAELTGRRFLPGQHNWIPRDGTLIAADSIELTLSDTLNNSGTVAADKQLTLTAATVHNNGGTLTGDQISAATTDDFNNLGGRIQAQSALTLEAGGDINLASTTQSSSKHTRGASLTQSSRTHLDRIADLSVTDPDGQLHLEAERDINLDAARLHNAGRGATTLTAGRDLNFGTLTTGSQTASVQRHNDANYLREGNSKEEGTQLQAAGDIALTAGANLNARAATVTSEHGNLDVTAVADIHIVAGTASDEFAQGSQITSSGLLSSSTLTKREEMRSNNVTQSVFSAEQLHVQAGGSATVQGSQLVSGTGTQLLAGRDIVIESATAKQFASSSRQEQESGLFGGPGISINLGSRTTDTASQSAATTQIGSMVGAIDGNVAITAGKNYRQTASTVMAASGSVAVDAQTITLNAGTDTADTSGQTRTRQTGITLAISNPIVSAAQTLDQLSHAASSTKDSRAQAMAASAAALTIANTAAAVQADPSHAGGVTASLTLGTSQSQSASTQNLTTVAASNVAAAQDIRISASGANDASVLSITGSQINAGRSVQLQTEGDLQLNAAANTATQRSTNSSSNAAVGVAATFGAKPSVGLTIAAGTGRGNADGDDVSWANTQVKAGQQISTQSVGHTSLEGATLSAEQVNMQVGGNLSITSVQDNSRYQSQQKAISGSATIGPASTANVNFNKQNVDSDYASVNQQTGIQAGDGGFTVAVKDTTTLTGGAITSTEQAVQHNKNKFSTGNLNTTDIANRAHYQAQAVGVSIGAGTSTTGALAPSGTSAGVGNASDSASSTTQAAISGIAGNKAARTGDASTGISKIFDAATVEKDVGAQVVIMQTFTREAPKAVANYADSQTAALSKQLNQETDSSKRSALQTELAKWNEGGAYRVALHAATGAIAGGLEGAIGAGAVAAAAPMLTDLQNNVVDKLKAAGANETVAKGAAQVIATSAAAAVGAATTGGSVQGAVAGIGVDANNRQLHQSEYDLAKRYKKIIADKLGISQDEAEGRIIRQIQRNVDADTAAKDSHRRDEPIIALMGCKLLKCDASVTDPNYKNSAFNREYIAPNQAAFDRGQQQTKQGLTPAQITDRNNSAGAPIAQAGALVLGGYVLAPAVAAIGAEAIAFTKNPVAYCAINPVSCIAAIDTVAGTAAGVPVTGVTVPHAVPKGGANSTATALDWTRIGTRIGNDAAEHVTLNHGSLSLAKPNQGVFYGNPVSVVEEAWVIAQRNDLKPITVGNRDFYVIKRANSGYAGGMGGQLQNYNHVTIITEAGTTRVVTAYPSGGTEPLPKGYNFLLRDK